MLELRIMQGRRAVPLFDLPTRLGRVKAAQEIGDAIEGLIAYLDDLGGDPDLEDSETGSSMVDERGHFIGADHPVYGYAASEQDEDREPDDDAQGDVSWQEWHQRSRVGKNLASEPMGRNEFGYPVGEDDELTGDEQDGNLAEDESAACFARIKDGPGCMISDPDKGGEEDGEEQVW